MSNPIPSQFRSELHEHIYWLRMAMRGAALQLNWSSPKRAMKYLTRIKHAVRWFKVINCLPPEDRRAVLLMSSCAQTAIMIHERDTRCEMEWKVALVIPGALTLSYTDKRSKLYRINRN